MQSVFETTSNITNRAQQITKQFSASATRNSKAQGTSGETSMASDDARVQNNQDFKLTELFNVKDKVALITGMRPSLQRPFNVA